MGRIIARIRRRDAQAALTRERLRREAAMDHFAASARRQHREFMDRMATLTKSIRKRPVP